MTKLRITMTVKDSGELISVIRRQLPTIKNPRPRMHSWLHRQKNKGLWEIPEKGMYRKLKASKIDN